MQILFWYPISRIKIKHPPFPSSFDNNIVSPSRALLILAVSSFLSAHLKSLLCGIRVLYMTLFYFKSTHPSTRSMTFPPTTHLPTINHIINVLTCFHNQLRKIFSAFDFEVKINVSHSRVTSSLRQLHAKEEE